MEIIGCGRGHYYNPELYSECPECAKEVQETSDDITRLYRKSSLLRGFSKPEFVASGSTGKVYRTEKDGKKYAVKIIKYEQDPHQSADVLTECDVMGSLCGCINVVPLVGSETLKDMGNTVVLLFQPYRTSFEDYYKSHTMTTKDVLQLGIDISVALEDCWTRGFAHLDIQPKNLFVDRYGHFCLGDFSCSLPVSQLNDMPQLRGTLAYMAPEVYERREYSQASEIYALGMVLYCLLNHGNIPFLEMGSKKLAVMTRLEQKIPVPSLRLGGALDQLLEKALAVDARQRYHSFEHMRTALQDAMTKPHEPPKPSCSPAPAAQPSPSGRSPLSWLLNKAKNLNRPGKAKTAQSIPEAEACRSMTPTTFSCFGNSSAGTLFDSDSLSRPLLPHMPSERRLGSGSPSPAGFSPNGSTLFDSDDFACTLSPDVPVGEPLGCGFPVDASAIGSCAPLCPAAESPTGTLFDSDPLASTCAPMPMDFAPVGSWMPDVSTPAPMGGTLFDSDTYATSCALDAPGPGRSAGNSAPPRMSQVQFSAIAPKETRKEDYAIIQLFMYEQAFRSAVEEAIAMADTPVQEKRSGFQKVRDNTRVKIVLTCPDMQIDDNVQEQVWCGGYLQFDFAICPPENFKKRQILLTAAVYFDDVPATRLMLTVKALASYEEEIELARQDVITAFVSYASQDRNRVGALVQGMRKARPDMDIFFDVTTLRSGENWENTLYREILHRDILFLCWSRNAMASEWVEREWRYALEKKGVDAIEPIPLEQPDICPPPKELWNKHFNDTLLYIINR